MSLYRLNVAALLVDPRGRVLICERYHIPGAWQFPQGGVDKGEEPLEALHREVYEEVAVPPEAYVVEAQRGGYRYTYPPKVLKRKARKNWIGQEQIYFLCRLHEEEPEINLSATDQEFSRYRWIWPEEFREDWLPDFKKEVYRAVFADFFEVQLEAK